MKHLVLLAVLLAVASPARSQAVIPACLGVNDTAAFSTIIATIGSSAGSITLPSAAASRCAINSLSIPANVTLDNSAGAGLKVNSGQTLTHAGPLVNPPHKALFYNIGSGLGSVTLRGNRQVPVVYPQWFGAVADGATNDYAATKAALDATPSPGHVHFPSGTYWLGAATTAARLAIAKNDITITGDGIQKSILKYDSDVTHVDASFGPGSGILIGDATSAYHGFVITDLTLEDTQTAIFWNTGHNPSGIDAYKVDRVRIERVEVVNSKGNAAITVYSPSKDGRDLIIRDSLIRGTAAGGWVQGSGINFASFSNLHIEDNWIEGVNMGGIGAGGCGACKGLYITGNTIDFLDRSTAPAGIILTGDGDGIVVSRNVIRRFAGGKSAIMIGTEDGGAGYPISNVVVSENVITATGQSSDRGVMLRDTWRRVAILGNQIKATYPILIDSGTAPLEYLEVANNVFENFASNVAAIANGPYSIAPTDVISIHDNLVTGTFEPLKLLEFTQSSIWKVRNVRLHGNQLGARSAQERNGQIDGATRARTGDAVSIPPNAATSEVTTTVNGALVGDEVTVHAGPAFDSGLVARGRVTAADSVKWRLFNQTAGALSTPAAPDNYVTIYIVRR